jgi:hypothetical protein
VDYFTFIFFLNQLAFFLIILLILVGFRKKIFPFRFDYFSSQTMENMFSFRRHDKEQAKKTMLLLIIYNKTVIYIQEKNTKKLLHAYNNPNFQKYASFSFFLSCIIFIYIRLSAFDIIENKNRKKSFSSK